MICLTLREKELPNDDTHANMGGMVNTATTLVTTVIKRAKAMFPFAWIWINIMSMVGGGLSEEIRA